MSNKTYHDSIPLDMVQFNIITKEKSTYQDELLEIFFSNSTECIFVMERNCSPHNKEKWQNAVDELGATSSIIGAIELSKTCAIAKQMDTSTEEEKIKMVMNVRLHVQRLRAFVRNTRY